MNSPIDPIPPTDIEAELTVISCALQWESTVDATLAIPLDAFTDTRARKVAGLLRRDRSEAMLEALDDPAIGPDVVNHAHTSLIFEPAVKRLQSAFRGRRILRVAQGLIRGVALGDNSTAGAEAELAEIGAKVSTIRHISEILPEAIEYIQQVSQNDIHAVGYPTGLHSIDNIIWGFRPSEMIVMAARPGIGKSALAAQIAAHIGSDNQVAFYTFEMSARALVTRLICAFSGIPLSLVRNNTIPKDGLHNITRATDSMSIRNVWIENKSGGSVADIRASAKAIKAKHGLAGVVVDYIQLVKPSTRMDSREAMVSAISRDLKELAMELDVFVLALCQLNRQAENTRPRIDQLRESGAIEQDADIVALLHRERAGEDCAAVLDIAKNRNGATGDAPMRFCREFTRFEDADRVSDADIPKFE